MALTRGKTGHAAPRTAWAPATTTTTKRSTKTKSKAKTAQPTAARAGKKTLSGRVTKTAPKKQKRHATTKDKIAGAVKKAVGAVEGKPGKKAAGTKRMKGTDGKGSKRA